MSLIALTKDLLARNDRFVSIARSFLSLFYLGPWRNPVAKLMAVRHRPRSVSTERKSDIVEIDERACSENLMNTGYSGTFRFSPELVDRILSEIPKDFSGHECNLHRVSPAMNSVVYDPKVIALVTEYLGVAPYVLKSELTSVNGTNRRQLEPGEACTKKFHYDVSDFRALTLFVYLNDVEPDGGAHVVIPATHRSLPLSKYGSRFLSYRQACDRYGERRMVSITGEKGTAFLEDLVNWHKRSLTNRSRICLSVTYTLNRTS